MNNIAQIIERSERIRDELDNLVFRFQSNPQLASHFTHAAWSLGQGIDALKELIREQARHAGE